jgi:hypothetical protein
LADRPNLALPRSPDRSRTRLPPAVAARARRIIIQASNLWAGAAIVSRGNIMHTRFSSIAKALGAAGVLLSCALIPDEALACACGCSVFDVGSLTLLPKEDSHGGVVYFEWDHADQKVHWSGASKGAGLNPTGDRRIYTDWYVAGMNYMVNRDWGVGVRIPSAHRSFTSNDGVQDNTYNINVLGDIELTGMYTGFSKDMSKGLIFGLKLPTGEYKAENYDRDTQVGTGSTDLILGGFWRGMITGDNAWQYVTQVKYVQPLFLGKAYNPDLGFSADYRPGTSLDASAGIVYNNWYHVGPFDKVAPLLQMIYSHKGHDGGDSGDPDNTGFDRIYISPGIDFTKVIDDAHNRTFKLYGDVEIPIHTHVTGDQQVAPYVFKLVAGYTF